MRTVVSVASGWRVFRAMVVEAAVAVQELPVAFLEVTEAGVTPFFLTQDRQGISSPSQAGWIQQPHGDKFEGLETWMVLEPGRSASARLATYENKRGFYLHVSV